MRTRYALVVIVVCAALAACSGGSEPKAHVSKTPAASAPTDVVSGKALDEFKDSPTYEWRKNLTSQGGFVLANLGNLQSAWSGDESLSSVLDVCLDLSDDKDAATVGRNTALRFVGGEVQKVSTSEAHAIVAIAKKYVCPELG